MGKKYVDLKNTGINDISTADIPNSVEKLDLSFNNIALIPSDFFYNKFHLCSIDLSHNQLSSISFLRCFKCLSELDLSNNFLDIDDLFDLRSMVIVILTIKENNFDDLVMKDKHLLPTILSHTWIINGEFITDFQREVSKKYEDTLNFGNSILSGRRFKGPIPNHISSAQAGKNLLFDHEVEQSALNGIKFVSPNADLPLKIDIFPQIERIKYLSGRFSAFFLPEGVFSDYFGAILGILTKIWIGESSINLIPHLVCRTFWFGINEEISEMENWQLIVVLYKLSKYIKVFSRIETDLWTALNLDRYLRTGKIPLIGSTPRLILAAFLSRAVAISATSQVGSNFTSNELSESSADDLRAYFKYRKICGFNQFDNTSSRSIEESVYMETVAPFYHNQRDIGPCPIKGDRIDLVHPLSGNWVSSTITYVKNGRIIVVLTGDDEVIAQIPLSSVFWDGRGVWREAAKRESQIPSLNFRHSKNTNTNNKNMFITTSEISYLNSVNDEENPSFAPRPPASARAGPIHRSNFTRNANNDQETIVRYGGDSVYIVRDALVRPPQFSRKPAPIDESKLLPGWRTFRGIVDPPNPKSQRSNRASARFLGPGQMIDDVVNVVKGNEYTKGQKVKRYNVRIFNSITEKSRYVWVTDDELAQNDVNELDRIYKKHTSGRKKNSNIVRL